MSESSRKKQALIIGASRGIGLAAAERLSHDGFAVAASCRKESSLDGLRNRIGTVEPLVFDVLDRPAILAEYRRVFGESAPDAVVFCAGIADDGMFALMGPEQWDRVLRTDLDGFYNTVQPLLGAMIAGRRGGRIVAVSSLSGVAGQAGQANYSAAKAGLIGAVKAVAREVGRRNILVNAVAPGVIETDMTKDLPKDRILPMIPLNRFGSPAEVAAAVSFLCGPDSSYITGQVIGINGGMYL